MNLEVDFAAWVDTRDPAALNRVFDATAGRLLLLAAHVGGTGTPAEDLVQATFLAAMAGEATWERDRPVWPWLAGILQNEARMELRRRRRRREVTITEASAVSAEVPDPLRLAASDEAFAAVMEAIDGLPLPYRQVLRLRLVHGLRNVEIAHTLELPVGTVRAQVHRGLARLREALPAGVAAIAGAWLAGEGALLAQVRAHVAEAAAEAAAAPVAMAGVVAPATTSWLLIGGWWTMHGKTLGILAAAAALILLLVVVVETPPFFGGAPVDPSTATLTVDAPPVAAPESSTESNPLPTRELAADDANLWPLTVTVVDSKDQPIPDAEVRVWADARGGERRGDGIREELAKGRTGAHGRFRCGLDVFRTRSGLLRHSTLLWLSALHAGSYEDQVLGFPREISPKQFEAKIQLRPSIRVVGRVLDRNSAPVADAEIYWLRSLTGRPTQRFERSGSDGRFAVCTADLDPFGVAVALIHPSHGTAIARLPEGIDASALGSTIDLGDILLEHRDGIRGRVVLGDGTGLAGFPLRVRALDPATAAAAAEDPEVLLRTLTGSSRNRIEFRDGRIVHLTARPVTGPDGAFACVGLDPNRSYAVYVRDTAMRKIPILARVGDDSLKLRVDRQLIVLDVRDESGDTLPGARVVARGFDPSRKPPQARVAKGLPQQPAVIASFHPSDAGGRRLLLSSFGWRWELGSGDEIARKTVMRHEALAGIHRVEKRLVLEEETRFGALRLVVVDEKGEPWPRFALILRHMDRRLERNHSRMVPQENGRFTAEDLLAGRWRLTTFLGQDHFFPLPAHVRGMRVQEVVIEDGETTEVRVEAKPAGLIGLRLKSAVAPKGGVWKNLSIRWQPTGEVVPYHGYDAAAPAKSSDYPRVGLLFLSKTAFPPGDQEFVVTADGYQPARCRVTVIADRYVTADLEMFRQ